VNRRYAIGAKPYALGVEKRSALRVATRHAPQGLTILLDGGCFSRAKIDRSICNVRLFGIYIRAPRRHREF
jgi:hypothetical protein